MFETIKRCFLLGFGLAYLIWTQAGCRGTSLAPLPQVQDNQEITRLGKEIGLKSYGESRNVSLYPLECREGFLDFLVVAENSHADPFYFGLEDIRVFDAMGNEYRLPSIQEVLHQLKVEEEETIQRIIAHMSDRYLNPRHSPDIPGGEAHPRLSRHSAASRNGTSDPELERSRENLRQIIRLIQAKYESKAKQYKEDWLQGEVVMPADYIQGIFRVNLEQPTATDLTMSVVTGQDYHEVVFQMGSEHRPEIVAAAP